MRWLADPSPGSLREALAELVPELAAEEIEIREVLGLDERFFRTTATVGRDHVMKFAWSKQAAERIRIEAEVLAGLARSTGTLVPQLVHEPSDLACFVTRRVDGPPFEWGTRLEGPRMRAMAADLAGAIFSIHGAEPDLVARAGDPRAHVQATPDELRAEESLAMIEPAQRPTLLTWCDWAENVLARPSPSVVVHGDLHGYNMVWDPDRTQVLLVADFETAGLGDPALDFRCLLPNVSAAGWVESVISAYRALGGSVQIERVAAWTFLTTMGDVRWRTLAGVGLAGGGTPSSWMADLMKRLPPLGAPVA